MRHQAKGPRLSGEHLVLASASFLLLLPPLCRSVPEGSICLMLFHRIPSLSLSPYC